METNDAEIQEIPPVQVMNEIKRKQHFSGKVVKTTLAGALIDIGLETPGVVHISQLQTDPVNRVEDIVQPGQTGRRLGPAGGAEEKPDRTHHDQTTRARMARN